MQIRVFERTGTDGPDRGPEDCLFVLGWGNRCRHEPVRWLVEQLRSEYRVHVAELPTHITDFRRQWVDPVRSYAADLGAFTLLAHSAGGLTTAHLDLDTITQRVYLSPWWGSDLSIPDPVLALLQRLPISRPVVPVGTFEREDLGELATDRQLAEGPDAASPLFIRTIAEAQATLPPGRDDAVVFGTLTDRIVDPRLFGKRVPADHIRLYDGGHELFSSRSRTRHLPTVLDALARGPAAL